eukprot:NODE_4844_length_1105_cov_21.756619_g4300_i0.p1 GENE.NODE_4844_length_1105_cov_21.756619_g4300_i0~~NODE_4844_length_1105_cov_21.756619_g4300_i0.p1  ORF type:complete len:328 (-),score=41.83 NODE_4844_length_1105_cov_21.756619_g4300_i0:122-1063(-)
MKLSLSLIFAFIHCISSLSDPLPLRNAYNAAISIWKSEGLDSKYNDGEWSANGLCPPTSTPYWPPISGLLADVIQSKTVKTCLIEQYVTNLDGTVWVNCTLRGTCSGRLVDTNQYLWNKVANHYGIDSLNVRQTVSSTSQECFDLLYNGTIDALTLNWGTSFWRDASGVTVPRDSVFHSHCPVACYPTRISTRNDTNITTLDKARSYGNANPSKILIFGTGNIAAASAFFNVSSNQLLNLNSDQEVIDAFFVKKTVDLIFPSFEAQDPIVAPYKSILFTISQSVTDSCSVGYFRLRDPPTSPTCYAITFNNNK